MATAAYAPRPMVEFPAGVPVAVTLKWTDGKEVNGANGPRFMFTTTDDKVFFVDHETAYEIQQAAKASPTVVIAMTKGPRNSKYWHVRAANSQQARDAQASASPIAPARPVSEQSTTAVSSLEQTLAASIEQAKARKAEEAPARQEITPAQAKLLAALCVAIDSCVEAQAYAQRRGLPLAFTGEDVRCFANTILINAERGAR